MIAIDITYQFIVLGSTNGFNELRVFVQDLDICLHNTFSYLICLFLSICNFFNCFESWVINILYNVFDFCLFSSLYACIKSSEDHSKDK